MKTNPIDRRALLALAGASFTQAMLAQTPAQTPARAGGNPTVFEHDLPDVNMHNWAVTVREINYGPGDTTAAHRHPGITLVYVLDGAIVSKVGNGPEKTYTQGQMFMESPGDVHAVSRNASATRPARFLALLLAEKGAQLTVPV
jgi:quercetin dioxygenase-like cupin family protein